VPILTTPRAPLLVGHLCGYYTSNAISQADTHNLYQWLLNFICRYTTAWNWTNSV